jgi:hypothetical protein
MLPFFYCNYGLYNLFILHKLSIYSPLSHVRQLYRCCCIIAAGLRSCRYVANLPLPSFNSRALMHYFQQQSTCPAAYMPDTLSKMIIAGANRKKQLKFKNKYFPSCGINLTRKMLNVGVKRTFGTRRSTVTIVHHFAFACSNIMTGESPHPYQQPQ